MISIFDPDSGNELKYDQIGEICISGLTLMSGYYNKAKETANTIRVHKDNKTWIHTGDIGYMNNDGNLYRALEEMCS